MKTKCLHLVATALLFFSYLQFNFAQAPNLGTAASFVIFSSSGAVGNTGALSHFTGNIGTNTGAITINVNVNGVIHNPDAVTIACKADVLSLYQQLDSAKSTLTLPPTIGFGDTLYAGVDSIGSSAVIDSNLVLDAKGDPNALFIFKITGTLGTMDSANIILLNGALACNVFWKVEGAVDLVSGTTMKGTIVANSGAIGMGDGVSLEGRALTSTAGAITTTNVVTYTPTGCGSAVHVGPAAPALASTSCYAIFSGNGAVINAGLTSQVTGDIGTNVGLTVGYNPLLVNGTIHVIPDASTAACAADLINVYTYLNTLPADIELLYPAQFGNNLVLTPHTYIMNAAASLTDTLYLNAEGDADAVFVIQINGALSTSTFSKVILTNGTQAKNVFWKVDGASSINDYSVFQGTMVVNNAAINLNTGVTLNGRALTTTGAFSTAAVNVIDPSGSCGTTILPLSMLYFRGKTVQEDALLEWATANEQNTAYFEIQQSIDQKTFMPVGTVKAAGTSISNITYAFTDKSVAALGSSVVYYRLKSIDIDGKFTYSNIVAIKLTGKTSTVLLYPNPVKESATMVISVAKADRVSYNIIDLSGKILSSVTTNLNAGSNTFNINVSGLAAGMYNITIKGEQTDERIKFIKQ